MPIPDSCRRVLWDRKWFYAKGEQPGPGVLDDGAEGKDLTESPNHQDLRGVMPVQPLQAHATRPVFLFDRATSTYYTVLHLSGDQVHTEPTVMCIKHRAAKQLIDDYGAKVGEELPAGVFELIFLSRWFYPKPDGLLERLVLCP